MVSNEAGWKCEQVCIDNSELKQTLRITQKMILHDFKQESQSGKRWVDGRTGQRRTETKGSILTRHLGVIAQSLVQLWFRIKPEFEPE